MRYLRLFLTQIRISIALGMQYRWEFLLGGALTLVWTAISLVPLHIAFSDRPPIQGCTTLALPRAQGLAAATAMVLALQPLNIAVARRRIPEGIGTPLRTSKVTV